MRVLGGKGRYYSFVNMLGLTIATHRETAHHSRRNSNLLSRGFLEVEHVCDHHSWRWRGKDISEWRCLKATCF